MDKHKCFGYMRVATAAQIVHNGERGKPYENLAQIYPYEKTPRGAGVIQRSMVHPDGSLLGDRKSVV